MSWLSLRCKAWRVQYDRVAHYNAGGAHGQFWRRGRECSGVVQRIVPRAPRCSDWLPLQWGLIEVIRVGSRPLLLLFRTATRTLSAGSLMSDFHTFQSLPSAKGKPRTRADALYVKGLETSITRREYRMDVCYQAAYRAVSGGRYSLSELFAGFKRPAYVLYLGRKCCPLSYPLAPEIIEARSVLDAFKHRNDVPGQWTKNAWWRWRIVPILAYLMPPCEPGCVWTTRQIAGVGSSASDSNTYMFRLTKRRMFHERSHSFFASCTPAGCPDIAPLLQVLQPSRSSDRLSVDHQLLWTIVPQDIRTEVEGDRANGTPRTAFLWRSDHIKGRYYVLGPKPVDSPFFDIETKRLSQCFRLVTGLHSTCASMQR